jgi:FkbM family methyltransferase
MDFSQPFSTTEDNEPFDPVASERDIYNCFRVILGRHPSHAEWDGHRKNAGAPLSSVCATFVDSAEYHALREANHQPRLAQLPGFVLYASPDDLDVGSHILNSLEWEKHVTRIFTERLSEGMTVLDIGANIGYFTFLAASRVGSSGRVWAIEPNRKNVAFLQASRARNRFDQVEIFQAAASDRFQILNLSARCSNGAAIEKQGAAPADFPDSVMALPLSAVLPRTGRIDVIKIDVEGAEMKALNGMLDLLERDRPVVFSEFTPSAMPLMSGIPPGEYLELFASRGYALAVIERSGATFAPATELLARAAAMPSDCHLDILAQPR